MSQGVVGIDLIPNAPIIEAFKRSGMNREKLAATAGYDSRSVWRMLGGEYFAYKKDKSGDTVKYGPYKQFLVKRENAERLIRAMDLDPVDFGL